MPYHLPSEEGATENKPKASTLIMVSATSSSTAASEIEIHMEGV